jgi:uracil-DNA glycosylase
LLVGIAPGEHGCALTGIPFTDEATLRTGGHPFLTTLGVSPSGNRREDAAQQVWKQAKLQQGIAAFWNVFPFHPHNAGKNRDPNATERSEGMDYLQQVIDILEPHTIVPVGAIPKASTATLAERLGLQFQPLPYPKYAGTTVFVEGYAALLAA